MGQTDDLLTAVAETLPNAILVGAVGFGDGDLAVFDSDHIMTAAGCGNGEFLVYEIGRAHV